MLVDAHFHSWQLARADYGWLTPALSPIYRDVNVPDWQAQAQAAGVTGGILVQAAPTEAETWHLLALADQHPSVLGVVGWVDWLAPDAAQRIDHSLPPAQPVAEGVTVEHGKYVGNMCIGCHGEKLSGGKIPGGPPDWPAAANITPGDGSSMTRYPDAAAFSAMMRSGKRPDGTPIKVMPFESISKISDVDLQALYAYLKTVPAKAAGGR